MPPRRVKPQFITPMAAFLVDTLPQGDEWLYEAKFDGYRAIAVKDAAHVKLFSRKGTDLTGDYPNVERAIGALREAQVVIDGEVVAFDEEGRPSFQHLHHRTARNTAIRYFA